MSKWRQAWSWWDKNQKKDTDPGRLFYKKQIIEKRVGGRDDASSIDQNLKQENELVF